MPRRPLPTVVAAWVVTGPVGHLWCGVADWSALGRHYAWSKLRGRDPWAEPFTP